MRSLLENLTGLPWNNLRSIPSEIGQYAAICKLASIEFNQGSRAVYTWSCRLLYWGSSLENTESELIEFANLLQTALKQGLLCVEGFGNIELTPATIEFSGEATEANLPGLDSLIGYFQFNITAERLK